MTKEQKAVSDRIRLSGGFKNRRLEALFRREKAGVTIMKMRLFFTLYAVMYSVYAASAQPPEVRIAGALLAVLSAVCVLRLPKKPARANILSGTSVLVFFVFNLLYSFLVGETHPLIYAGLLVPFIFPEIPLKTLIYLTLLPFFTLKWLTGAGSGLAAVLIIFAGTVFYVITSYMRRSYFLHMRRESAGERTGHFAQAAGNGSGKDLLTGLKTLDTFLEQADSLLKGKPAENDSFIIVCDIDGFDKINRAHGQEAGDMILQGTAQRLRSMVSPADIIARTGGGEFSVLLADETEATAGKLAERIRINIENSRWKTPKSESMVTVSAGIAIVCPEGTENAADVFYKAREAMFTAKANGRNRTAFYSSGEC
ncbi:GGDEF domain-containing protein [Geovibrio thiophilus]|uniref:diguanylate cyclase n=1 Tax=Geovibrio thiophilus TaxID=139438 RepID=A0A410JWF7_9BACT|nr:GGDEF domain-containing protein [Geovibrio thiophilus]QAR32522.1 GGDEF domain-containing protein [Geovibrio thiophilus]